MEIAASGTVDAETSKLLTRLYYFATPKPGKKRLVYFLLDLLLALVVIGEGLLWGFMSVTICLMCLCALHVFLLVYWYFMLPSLRCRAMTSTLGTTSQYISTDEGILVTTVTDRVAATENMTYSFLKSVVETADRWILYGINGTACVVDKQTVPESAWDSLRHTLKSHVSRYRERL